MGRSLRDPNATLRRHVLRAMMPAIKEVTRVAAGGKFGTDHCREACMAIMRTARMLIANRKGEPRRVPRPHPSHSPEKARQLLLELRALQMRSQSAVLPQQPPVER
jgi:hypothetical protein